MGLVTLGLASSELKIVCLWLCWIDVAVRNSCTGSCAIKWYRLPLVSWNVGTFILSLYEYFLPGNHLRCSFFWDYKVIPSDFQNTEKKQKHGISFPTPLSTSPLRPLLNAVAGFSMQSTSLPEARLRRCAKLRPGPIPRAASAGGVC